MPSGSWQWEIVLSAPEACDIKEVQHNGTTILSTNNREYRPANFSGNLTVEYGDGEREVFPLFEGESPLIFKLRNNWKGNGRKMSGITRGHFSVFAPCQWTRTGDVSVEPAGCADPGFLAHYFFRGQDDAANDMGGFKECTIALTKEGFSLNGAHVFDDSEDGELFVHEPPQLKPAPEIVWARVGEERQGGWKGENFKPADTSLGDILGGRQGRFFVRAYDDAGKLTDSGEFRYCKDLREIWVNGKSYSQDTLLVPSSDGHAPTMLQFIGTDGNNMPPEREMNNPHVRVREDGVVTVEPLPEGDEATCTLISQTGCMDVVIKLPRIWWRLEQTDGDLGPWGDTSLVMTRQEFRDHANASAEVQLRLPSRIRSVDVGFDNDLNRRYRPAKIGDDTILPLADFVDYSQIDNRLNNDALLQVQCERSVLTIIRVTADSAPTIVFFTADPVRINSRETATLQWRTENVGLDEGVTISHGIGPVGASGTMAVTPTETTTFALRLAVPGLDDVTASVTVTVLSWPQKKPCARVKRASGGWRRGKGFSRGELRTAGLIEADATRWSISIDKRRRSMHGYNIETIRSLIDD